MRSRPSAAALLLTLALCASTASCAGVVEREPPRETVLERKVRIYDEIVEVPEVPPPSRPASLPRGTDELLDTAADILEGEGRGARPSELRKHAYLTRTGRIETPPPPKE